MVIGIDFDNTIVCYDAVFPRVAAERGLVPPGIAGSKGAVRDYLRKIGQEDRWTELQGYVYGPGMREAPPFDGVIDFFRQCRRSGVPVFVISHRTRYPYLGEQYDLHQSAGQWLLDHGFHDPKQVGLPAERVFFELTKEQKLTRIAEIGCTHFVDDLPEFLGEAGFPAGVQKILFDPTGRSSDRLQATPKFVHALSWEEVQSIVDTALKADEPPPSEVAALLDSCGLAGDFFLDRLAGGGNNRVYELFCKRGGILLLKEYFRHPDDPRNRVSAEFDFCKFAWDSGVRCVPRPWACNRNQGLGLYGFIEGQKLSAEEITWPVIQEAIDFHRSINAHRNEPAAQALTDGSEACFTLAQHLHCVDRRLARLGDVDRSTPSGAEAAELITSRLRPAWDRICGNVIKSAEAWGLPLDRPIDPADRRLSPSDFGFHNAIRAAAPATGEADHLVFIDFEYAGWDDPAKTVCDFFCQPAIPVPAGHFSRFAQALAADLSDPAGHVRRMTALWPVYRIKWCCIMLNEFSAVGSKRRGFARGEDMEARQTRQLEKVTAVLAAM